MPKPIKLTEEMKKKFAGFLMMDEDVVHSFELKSILNQCETEEERKLAPVFKVRQMDNGQCSRYRQIIFDEQQWASVVREANKKGETVEAKDNTAYKYELAEECFVGWYNLAVENKDGVLVQLEYSFDLIKNLPHYWIEEIFTEIALISGMFNAQRNEVAEKTAIYKAELQKALKRESEVK